jgi:hypothetical protein
MAGLKTAHLPEITQAFTHPRYVYPPYLPVIG